jgi:hypothetical protein
MATEIAQLKANLTDLNMKCQLARDNEVRFALQRGRLEAERASLLVKMIETLTPAAMAGPAAAPLDPYRVVMSSCPAGADRPASRDCLGYLAGVVTHRRKAEAQWEACRARHDGRNDHRGDAGRGVDATKSSHPVHTWPILAGCSPQRCTPGDVAPWAERSFGEGRRRLPFACPEIEWPVRSAVNGDSRDRVSMRTSWLRCR